MIWKWAVGVLLLLVVALLAVDSERTLFVLGGLAMIGLAVMLALIQLVWKIWRRR